MIEKTLEPIDVIESYELFRYKKHHSRFGTAELRVDAVHISDAVLTSLVEGRFGIIVSYQYLDDNNTLRTDSFIGYAVKWTYEVGKEIKTIYDSKQMCNEVIIIGPPDENDSNNLATRDPTRVNCQAYEPPSDHASTVARDEIRNSASIYGLKERVFDGRGLENTSSAIEKAANNYLYQFALPRITQEFTVGGIAAVNRARGKYYIEMRDILGYLEDRVIDTTSTSNNRRAEVGLGTVDGPASMTAVDLAKNLIERELFAPESTTASWNTHWSWEYPDQQGVVRARRKIDVLNVSLSASGTGATLGEGMRWRWSKLSEAITEVCDFGDINLQATRDSVTSPSWVVQAKPNENRIRCRQPRSSCAY